MYCPLLSSSANELTRSSMPSSQAFHAFSLLSVTGFLSGPLLTLAFSSSLQPLYTKPSTANLAVYRCKADYPSF